MPEIIKDNNNNIISMPVLALRALVVFPGTVISFDVSRKKSAAARNTSENYQAEQEYDRKGERSAHKPRNKPVFPPMLCAGVAGGIASRT